MPQYTTGELAKLCGVSVRTVQFYDGKDLLKPTELTEGGRRLYSDDDLKKMQSICLLKSIGLSLGSVKGILESEAPQKVMLLLLDEQEKQLESDIEAKQTQLKTIHTIKDSICSGTALPANSISDIEHMMDSRKKLRKAHLAMLVIGLIMDAIQIGALALWIVTGIWWPFAAGISLVILMGILITRMYYKNVAYICAECNATFRPSFRQFTFSNHTRKTRKLKCPACGHIGFCVEVVAKDPAK